MNLEATKLPPGWKWTTMGEIADVVGGGTPKTKDPTNFEGGSIPWLTPADLSGYTEKYIGCGARSITQKGLDGSSAKLMPKGTVLFTSRAPIGYVAIAANPISTNQGFKSFVLKEGVLPDYVYWWLSGSKALAESLASGTTFLELSGAKAKQIPIPIAPADQQAEIVAEIEKQFSRLDEAVTNLHRVKANLKRYKAAVLKAAVEGRLVETEAELARREGRAYESGEQLLQRILETRRSQWRGSGKYKEPATLGTSELPESPKGWSWATLEMLADVVDPNPSHRMPKYVESGVPFVSSENFFGEDGIDFAIGKKVATETLKQQRERFSIKKGDFALSRIGTIGKTRFLPIGKDYCLSHALVVIKEYSNSIHKEWLRRTISSDSILSQARDGIQSVGVPDLGMAKIRNFILPLPPADEQRRIAEEIDRRLSVLSRTTAYADAALRRAERLRQSLLAFAFRSPDSAVSVSNQG